MPTKHGGNRPPRRQSCVDLDGCTWLFEGANAEEVWWEQVTKKAKTADREVLGGLMVGLLG